jgi:alpha-ribazole phosphatase/probable phosphoglycerate mutase
MAVHIVFETHATSVDNERGIASGWLSSALSATGRQQARQLGQRRLAERVDVVFTSDLRRAVQTAALAFGEHPIPIQQDWRLRECNYGDLNGAPTAQLDLERLRRIAAPFPNGESYAQVVDRVREFLADLGREWAGAGVVLIGHSATRWALEQLLHGIALEELVGARAEWQPGWRYVLG